MRLGTLAFVCAALLSTYVLGFWAGTQSNQKHIDDADELISDLRYKLDQCER